jgi:hypothetical protein
MAMKVGDKMNRDFRETDYLGKELDIKVGNLIVTIELIEMQRTSGEWNCVWEVTDTRAADEEGN